MNNLLAALASKLTLRMLLALAFGAVALGWGAIQGVDAWWYRSELTRAGREQVSGQYATARDRLARLAARWPGRAEVEYPLGDCEAAMGHVDAALAAWGRVPGRSAMGLRAALDRGRFALEHGRLAVAEESLAPLLGRPGEVGEQAARLADQVDLFLGRSAAIGRRIERRWPTARDQVELLHLHWQLDTQPFPIGAVGEVLDRMGRESPDDDRVWLGRARLATRKGRYSEADELLRRCETERPDDPDVWQARLDWAIESRRPDEAIRAAAHIPASGVAPAAVVATAAKLAALRGDPAAERAALDRRVALEPGDTSAWERLAELAARDGASDRVARFRSRKAEMDRDWDEYRILMGAVAAGDRSRFADLARIAETLGRRFEALGWWTIRVPQDTDDRSARAGLDRLARPEPTATTTGRSLADILPMPHAAPADIAPAHATAPVVPIFRDDAERAGLRFTYDNDPTPMCRMPETMGGGVGLLDYDGDGWLDVYAVQGGPFANESTPPPSAQRDRLFRNRGEGTFQDVTQSAGLGAFPGGYGHGVAVGDYDNDGHPDLFITRWRSYALYRNKGNGTFEDATERAGLAGARDWPTSAAFADLDGDGDLDLYVCHYADWDPQRSSPCPHPGDPRRHAYCVPRSLGAMPDRVYRNDSGRFVDVTARAGIVDRDGRGLGVVIADLDDDGRPDIYVANDMTANLLFHNLGGFRFEEVGEISGAGASGEGGYQAGMGIACGDLDGDGRPELAVTNFYGESTSLFHNLGQGLFADRTAATGLSASSRFVLGFGAAFLDANNDGRLDLAQANGHVNDYRPAVPYAMPAQLWLGTGSGRLAEVSASAGACWQVPRLGRGLAVGDLDNDGRPDLVIVAEGQPLAYFHNQGPAGHSVTFQLEGTGTGSNRDAVGTRLTLTASGHRQVSQRVGGSSFLSANDGRLHFGVGQATWIESIEVRWPSGRVDRYADLAADTGYLLREGQPEAGLLRGWRRRRSQP